MKRLEAIAHFRQKTEDNPMDADAHHNLAVLYKSAGDMELYARHSRIALLTQHGGPKVWSEHALALMQQGKAVDARTTLLEVIAQWPTFAPAYTNIAALLARTGQYEDALPHCMSAIRHSPQDPALHRNIAKVYESLGRTSEALLHYQRALALAPDDSALARRIALLSLSRGRTDLSVAHYRHHRALNGDHFDLKL